MATFDDINNNLEWMVNRLMLFATRILLNLLVNVSASESKDNLLTSAIHIVSLYYGSMYRYTKKSLLEIAIEEGQPEAVKCLIDLGEPIDKINVQGKSPLHLAILHGQSAIVEYLLDKGADFTCLTLPIDDGDQTREINADGKPITYNQTPLHLAISNGNESIVSCLIDRLSNRPDQEQQPGNLILPESLNIKDSEGLTPLCLAKKLNNLHMEQFLENNLPISANLNNAEQNDQVSTSKKINCELISSSPLPISMVYNDHQEKLQEEKKNLMEEKDDKMVAAKESKTCFNPDETDKVSPNNEKETIKPLTTSKLLQRRDPLARLLNLHLVMKSDDEIRYDNKLRNPNTAPVNYSGRRKVSFVTEYFEKIESRRESLYHTDSGRWPTPDISSMSDSNGNIFQETSANKKMETIGQQCQTNQKQHYESSIHEAATNGSIDAIASHLAQRVSIDLIDTDGNTALHYAARSGQSAVVTFLLSKGANVKFKNSEGRTALHVACFSGDADSIRQLILAQEIDLEAKDNEKNTALSIASSLGHLKLVQLLTFSGAQVNVKNGRKQTPVHKAAFNGFADVVDHLIVKGGHVNVVDSEKDTPLHLAAHKGHIETVRILLDYGATVDVKNKLKRRPIHEAAYNGSVEVMSLLLTRKTNLNSKDTNGDTALNLAAAMGHSPIIELLLNKGAKINPKKDKCTSALHMATINENLETLEFLLSRKANIAVRDKNGDTPLHYACSQGNAIIVQTLLNWGSPVNVKGSFGRTPLHLAILNDQTKIVRLLLEKDADKTTKDSDGKTALQYAKCRGYTEAIQELSG